MASKTYKPAELEAIPLKAAQPGDSYRYKVGDQWYVVDKGGESAHKAIVDDGTRAPPMQSLERRVAQLEVEVAELREKLKPKSDKPQDARAA